MKMKTYKRWVGKKFGLLTIISENDYYDGIRKWYCACDCGKTCVRYHSYLLQSPKPSCGCAQRDPRAGLNAVFHRYRRQAEERSISWNLKKDQVFEIISKSCIYCGEPPSNIECASKRKYNGIDRLDSKKGYERGNVFACCIRCNRAKSDMTLQEFEKWVEQVHQHLLKDPQF